MRAFVSPQRKSTPTNQKPSGHAARSSRPPQVAAAPTAGTAVWEAEANDVALDVLGGQAPGAELARMAAASPQAVPEGASLPSAVRQILEPRLGYDLSTVSIRSATETEQAASPAGTQAFASGKSVALFP